MTRLHPKHTHATVSGLSEPALFKVLAPEEALGSEIPKHQVLVWDDATQTGRCASVSLVNPRDARVIRSGDIVRLRPNGTMVSVLYRRGSRANALFATERCNSLCLMCSQPPRDEDDSWLIDEMLQLVPLVDKDEVQLGITGGEPTLLGEGLVRVLNACAAELPDTHIHILTNGRFFADPAYAEQLVRAGGKHTTWAVPLYADAPEKHDEVVGSPGAFRETMMGLAEMARLGARVEIRVVLHKLTIPRLPQLAAFIYRRLPFVEHVALMGLEPMGFAKGNREILWIDPADYLEPLEAATRHLADRGIPVSIYNLPLCVVPDSLHGFARQSISDWKNTFPEVCDPCARKDRCAGFFASAGTPWRSRAVRPFLAKESVHELA